MRQHREPRFFIKKYREAATSRYFCSEWKYIYCYLLYLYYISHYRDIASFLVNRSACAVVKTLYSFYIILFLGLQELSDGGKPY